MQKGPVILERRYVPKGTIFIKQGDDAYSAYLIQSGKVSVYVHKDGDSIELAQLGMGQICGEMALINEDVRGASVKALEDCNLIIITRTAFAEKISNSDPMMKAIMQMLIDRLKYSNQTRSNKGAALEELKKAAAFAYDDIGRSLGDNRQREFKNIVGAKLDDFMLSLQRFTRK